MLSGWHFVRQKLEGHKTPLRLANMVPTCFSVAAARITLSSGFVSINECYHSEIRNIRPNTPCDGDGLLNELAGKNIAFIAKARTNPSASPCVFDELGKRP